MRFAGLGVATVLVGVIFSAPVAAAAGGFPAFGVPFETGQPVHSASIHPDNGTSRVGDSRDF
ncbi:hypothetical protein [Amycolatopsis sp. NPDC051071]|uniref:hypothetical protein n=1 Tax=Amycolatopsis sp. NPDC051071 TaxID=3154637 RepID=UPI003425E352